MNLKHLKTYESYTGLAIDYIKLYGEPVTLEDKLKMRSWIEGAKKAKLNDSEQEFQRLTNIGYFSNRLKTWESSEERISELKKKWIAKNGRPVTDEQKTAMMEYIHTINNEETQEPSLNYFGEETRQIPHY